MSSAMIRKRDETRYFGPPPTIDAQPPSTSASSPVPASETRVDPREPPTRVVHERLENGNLLVKRVDGDGRARPWLRVAESRFLNGIGLVGAGLYADARLARGRHFAAYVGRALGPQPDDDEWEIFESLTFAGDDFDASCAKAIELMGGKPTDVAYTWVRNAMLECVGEADMLCDIDGVQVDAGRGPTRPDERPGEVAWPAHYAHMANAPFGSDSAEPNAELVGSSLRALRDLRPGEEILWDYGDGYRAELATRSRRTAAENLARGRAAVEKARGLLRFMKACNGAADAGALLSRGRRPPTRVQPGRAAKGTRGRTRYAFDETDAWMMERIGIAGEWFEPGV